MTKLTAQQTAEIKSEMIDHGTPVRFLKNGQAMQIGTGQLCSRGTNVIHHPFYWNFTRETVKKICDWLGVKAVWSK